MKKITKFLLLSVALIFGCTGQMWGNSHSTHYGKVAAGTTSDSPSGAGTVYAGVGSAGSSSSATWNCNSSSSNDSKTGYWSATPAAGYYLVGWYDGASNGTQKGTSNPYTESVSTSSTNSSSPATTTRYAKFAAVGVSGASGVTINITDPDAEYTGTVSFTTSHADATNDFKTPAFSGGAGGTFAVSNWDFANNAVSVNYSFKPGSYLTGTKTLTLTSAGGQNSGTATFNITRPNIVISSGDAGAQLTPSTPTIDASGSCTFDVQYTNGASEFTAAFSNATSGTWTISSIDYAKGTDGKGTITVNYTFNAGGATGNHSADLTLTANTAGGASYKVTPTAYTEAVKDYDAEVFKADGTSLKQGTWAACLSVANTATNAGCTLQLARDVMGLAATQTISNTFTIDLNGKTLSGTVNGSLLNTSTASKTLTIKDSKNGGTIKNEASYNGVVRALYLTKGLVVLESGTLSVNNTLQYNSNASTTKSMQARTVEQAANTTFTQKGGRIEAYGTRNVYGVLENSSSANTTYTNLNGGEIYAEGPYNVFGAYAYGQLNVTDGMTINSHVNTNMVDAKYAADNANNTNNGYAYGIYMGVSSNKTASSCYYGTLNMTGGTLNVTNDRTKASSLYAYGVYFNATSTGLGTATAPDGSMANQAASMGTIDGATINVTTGTYYGYGVMVYGSYNSKTNAHHVVSVQNSTINVKAHTYTYGVCSNVSISGSTAAKLYGDVELTNNTITAESTVGSTAYGVYVASTATTIYADGSYSAYAGEYAVGAKMTVNSGTYLAKTKTSSAYGACSSTRSITTYGPEHTAETSRTPGGHAEAYAELIIKGGKFRGETTTSTSRGLSVGGNTTVTGGEFEAYSTTTTAYGIYATSGKTTVTGAKVTADATKTAYGIYADVYLPDGQYQCPHTGFAAAADMTLNNCNVTATTRSDADARGINVVSKAKMHNWAQFKADSTSWKWSTANYNAYKQAFACAIAGRDSVGIASAASVTVNGGTYTATAATTTAYGAILNQNVISTNGEAIADGRLTIKNATISAETKGTTNAFGVYAGGKTVLENSTISAKTATTTGYGVISYCDTTTINNCTISATGTTTQYGIFANVINPYTSTDIARASHVIVNGGTVTATTTGGNTAYGLYVERTTHTLTQTEYDKITHTTYPKPYVGQVTGIAATAEVNGTTITATPSGSAGYAVCIPAASTAGSLTVAPKCTINGGKFKGKEAPVNASAAIGNLVLNGGYYTSATNTPNYIAQGKVMYNDASKDANYPYFIDGYREDVAVAKNTSTSTTYNTLKAALDAASSGQVVTLISDCILKDAVTVKSGVTLLVPFSISNTVNTTTCTYSSSTGTISRYSLLKMVSGAKITVDNGGAICVNSYGITAASGGSIAGRQRGPYGQIEMEEGSEINLSSGANLYAWGYITGKGYVIANSGAKLYEPLMFDWRGGSHTSSVVDDVLPLNQYYVQNIEANLTVYSGATETMYTAITASFVGDQAASANLISSDGMFILNSGSHLNRYYDGTTDRIIYDIYGNGAVNGLSVKVSSYSMDSKSKILPLTNNMTIRLHSGTVSVKYAAELLADARIEVDEDATLDIQNNFFVFDRDDYVGKTIACSGDLVADPYVAGRTFNNATTTGRTSAAMVDAAILVNGTLKTSSNGYLYTTTGKANIYSTGNGRIVLAKGAGSTTSFLENKGTTSSTQSISCTPAYLKNANGNYVATSGIAANTEIRYVEGTWTTDFWTAQWKDGTTVLNTTYALSQPASSAYTKTPTKTGYTFNGWTSSTSGKAVTYTAQWTPIKYTITWLNEDGSQIDQTQVDYDAMPTHAELTKATDVQYTYTWKGWNTTIVKVTGDATYQSLGFDSKLNSYTITWVDEDNNQLDQQTVNYGEIPTYQGAAQSKTATAEYTYTWNGWDSEITAVTGNKTYKSKGFTATANPYTVTFDANGHGDNSSATVSYNAAVTKPSDPSVTGYTFDGWYKDADCQTAWDFGSDKMPAENLTLYAKWTKQWHATWVVGNDTTSNYYDTKPAAGADPTLAGYDFVAWKTSVNEEAKTVTYTALFVVKETPAETTPSEGEGETPTTPTTPTEEQTTTPTVSGETTVTVDKNTDAVTVETSDNVVLTVDQVAQRVADAVVVANDETKKDEKNVTVDNSSETSTTSSFATATVDLSSNEQVYVKNETKDEAGNVTATTYTPATDVEIREAVVAETKNENTLVILPTETQVSTTTETNAETGAEETVYTPNVITKTENASGETELVCQNLVITENTPTNGVNEFQAPEDFTAAKVSYERAVTSDWGTICMPFTLHGDENIKYYTFSGLNDAGTELMFNEMTDDVEPNTPVVFQRISGDVNINKTSAEIKKLGESMKGSACSDWELIGTYKQEQFTATNYTDFDKSYYIASDKFWKFSQRKGGVVTLKPFRAYFHGISASAPSRLSISVVNNAGTVTHIGEIDADGNIQKSDKFIQDGRLYIRKNGQVFDAKGQLVK